MAWTKEWTIDSVAGNYKAIGMVDPEDIEQLIADSRELSIMKLQLEVANKGYELERERANSMYRILKDWYNKEFVK